ncbi:putative aryl-alcohol dehydrogenase Aad16p [[Candida] anglica]|uniref:Aryl-alcohol dehydrogenase Aad16p n=1 Tax=[Candida] anglica TaxID=148631 RepID=A0ABP0EGL1_9ASCO
MEYQNLGDSGLKISKIIVGCMSYGDKKWADWVIEDEEKIFKIMKKCYDNGIRTFDTADVYSNGKSEELLGKFIKKYSIPRDKIVILTKLFFPVDNVTPGFKLSNYKTEFPAFEYINSQGLSRKHIFEAAAKSVERLGTYSDVLQIHRLDRSTPKAEIMRALNDVVLQGLTRYLGASTMRATEFAQLQFIAEKNGWFKFISMQNYYNLLYREEEREMIPFCNDSDLGKVGLIPWSPNARGILTRPLSQQSDTRSAASDKTQTSLGLDALSDADKATIERVESVAKEIGVSMAVVATAWVISKGCAPIVGLNSEERVDDIIKAVQTKLTPEQIEFLEGAYVSKAVVGI